MVLKGDNIEFFLLKSSLQNLLRGLFSISPSKLVPTKVPTPLQIATKVGMIKSETVVQN